MQKEIQIVKNTGESEPFDREKLRESLLRASASLLVTNDVIKQVEKTLKDGMTTSKIYDTAFALLKKKEKRTALRYSMKRSLLDLGPTGFPFEKFVAEIFKAKGYKTSVGIRLDGKCVDHEIDVLAYNETDLAIIEVKFHNSLSIKTDTKVALYVKARYDDMKDKAFRLEKELEMKPTRGILITNTKFTRNAEKYAKCNDLGMISWDYPQKGNLYDLINETKLHPITTVEVLKKHQMQVLIDKGFITANQLCANPDILSNLKLSKKIHNEAISEAKSVCEIK
jgi:Holliday junction resolvase-like predicted endonuclease